MAAAQGALVQGYRLGPRVPMVLKSVAERATRVVGLGIPSKIIARASASTTCVKDGGNLCEKPEGGNSMTLPIVLGVVIPLVVIACVLFYLHRRNVKRLRKEDNLDPHKSLDFGLAMDATKQTAKSKRKSSFFGGEKDMFHPKSRQLSMDMNLSSPYLLPPEVQQSRESLHSLARTLHQNEDPYRPVTHYAGSDVASMRSFQKDVRDGASIRTGATSALDDRNGNSRSGSAAGSRMAPPRPHRMSAGPQSPRGGSPKPAPFGENSDFSSVSSQMPSPPPPVGGAAGFVFEPAFPAAEMAAETGPVEADGSNVPPVAELQAPEPAATKISRKGLPVSPRPQDPEAPPANHRSTTGTVDEPFIYDSPNRGLRHDSSTYADFDLKLDAHNDRDSHGQPLSSSLPKLALGGPFDDETFLPGQATTTGNEPTLPHIVTPDAEHSQLPIVEPHQYGELFPEEPGQEDDGRGRSLHKRQSSEYPQDGTVRQSALGLPQMDTRRLSVGFRPLPPDELIESEDPETRANRIRSFYKEYFDESKPDMAEYNQHYPPHGVPAEWREAAGGGPHYDHPAGGAQYYEDYDQSYNNMGDGAYFDPQSNSFVMPYAQPVSRRAMTPPPSGSRFPGGRPRGGPRPFHGSMGGGGMGPGGPGMGMGMSRPGSSMSSQWGPRPGSSLSSRQMPGSRSASNLSGRFGGGPRKPMPPPEDLITLPTPSKLRDDSFALMGAIDFAPPPTFRDQTSGRSQSPLGERKPYQMNVPSASPLVSSFDEMAALPSPTFTGLDFAPPRKFKDNDTMSDAGSIRSNRSGISAMNQAAIRSGAGRVSRLPGDNVFTQAALADQLKPTWGFRP
ncbi:hypothetical protein SPBR_03902 [Sporothrix brasiliensis 5110]|uniref:Uncharacterized protein n=1 Tax=Sporothrix brasiliensis 5110 TaxID=1398154 RepID=A0A0C2FW57_9PEZI|nr:uncharacterized protein SPBR_03902 [Sporothrix brasiliensis 5110]KIH95248.1 hypothetical protein SPBR_03902 [Sporothrix brasiliensis 5110]